MKSTKLAKAAVVVAVSILVSTTFGLAAELPGGYTCGDVKNTVATYGAAVVLAAARQRGITEKEISHIRQQCRV